MKYLNFLLKKSNYLIGFQLKNNSYKTLFNLCPSKIGKFNRVIQLADPFLFVKNESLYCFYEKYITRGKGTIEVAYSSDLKKWEHLNVNLNVNCHLSFPFIFQENEDNIYMIPETGELNEVGIYKCEVVPSNWKKHKVLLTGNYVDSHIFKSNGLYFLFTTIKHKQEKDNKQFDYRLELYFSNRIDGDYQIHPSSPISIGRVFGRSAGALFVLDGKLLRPVQDCDESYGREVHVFEILELSSTNYKEKLLLENYIQTNWKLKHGGHHLSFVNFKNEMITAVDYNFKESYFQRFINILGL